LLILSDVGGTITTFFRTGRIDQFHQLLEIGRIRLNYSSSLIVAYDSAQGAPAQIYKGNLQSDFKIYLLIKLFWILAVSAGERQVPIYRNQRFDRLLQQP